MAVDHSRQQVKTPAVDHLVIARQVGNAAVYHLAYVFAFYHHAAVTLTAFVDDDGIMDNRFHVMSFFLL